MVNGARDSVLTDGALPLKVKILMSMLCDALLGQADGVTTIANRARAAGATEEEIAETMGVAFLFGMTYSKILRCLSWCRPNPSCSSMAS